MDWCAAYSWLRNKPKILITATEHPVYFVAASGQDDITENMADTYVQSFEEQHSVSLDEYKALRLGVWKIIFNKDDYLQSTCTCRPFLKDYMCKHILGLAIQHRLVTVPPQTLNVPLDQKPRRGRPKKATDGYSRD